MRASRFDINRDNLMEDILQPEGWLTSIKLVRNVRRGGLCHYATVCSTWIYLCRASTSRSTSRPLGDTSLEYVNEANSMCARVAILLVFGSCLLSYMVHEQPHSSVMPMTKFFLWAKQTIREELQSHWREYFTWLGAFNGPTCKPTQLLSTAPWAGNLRRTLSASRRKELQPDDLVVHLPCHTSGRPRVSGASGLKASQAYPKEFAFRFLELAGIIRNCYELLRITRNC